MASLLSLAALALLAPPSAAPAAQGATYLVSIADVPAGHDELLDRFTIETWGLDILAICSIPPGWQIRAGRTAAPDGLIEGEATHGVTRLDRERLSDLANLALVRMWGPVQGGTRRTGAGDEIASFFGHAVLESAGGGARQVPLTLEQIRLTPAARCPEASF
jgi:hypothetical protein